MSTPTGLTFSCLHCQARFALNPQVAGKKIACPCGNIFPAPPMPEGWDRQAYSLTDADSSPPTQPAPPPAEQLDSILAAYPRRKPARPVMQEEATDVEQFSPFRDRIAPIAMLMLGFALRAIELPMDRGASGASLGAGMALATCQIILTTTLMLAGMLAAAKILGANFGPLNTAILKLCAISVFAWTCGTFLVAVCHDQSDGAILAIRLTLLIDFFGIWLLFSLGLQEALLTAAICGFLQAAAALTLFARQM